MKEFIKKQLSEDMSYRIVEELMGEDYPSTFDMEHFKTLKSFNQRVKYCQDKLKRISSGSSRIVYIIDDTKVLKLAKNTKGIAQNEVEIEYSQYNNLKDVVANTFDNNMDSLWVEMELARKVRKSDFQRIIGYSFEDYCKAINNYGVDSGNGRGHKYPMDKAMVESMWENEFMYEMFSFIGNYALPVGDLLRLSSYGLVTRNGEDTIVMIDYGLTNDIYTGYYS